MLPPTSQKHLVNLHLKFADMDEEKSFCFSPEALSYFSSNSLEFMNNFELKLKFKAREDSNLMKLNLNLMVEGFLCMLSKFEA
jgi:hypothetical protein